MKNTKSMSTKTLVMAAVLTALVVILQSMGIAIRFGTFSVSLVLIPIVIGTATCGKNIGAWLGLVFGIVVLLTGDAAPFLAVNAAGTIITVLLKGLLCGYLSGLAYNLVFKVKHNDFWSTAVAAVVCPIVNTGIFLLGCLAFFMPTVASWAVAAGLGENVGRYMIFVLVGGNFLFELAVNIILAPIIVRIIKNINKA